MGVGNLVEDDWIRVGVMVFLGVRKSDLGEVLEMVVFVIGMGILVRVGCGDGWIWEYWDNEVIVMELGFEWD